MNRELAVIIPTLNEKNNIEPLMRTLQDTLKGIDWEVIFVDDDSADGTADVVARIGKEDDRVKLLKRVGRQGLSSAIIEGMHKGQAPYLAVMDADLQHDAAVLAEMFSIIKQGSLDAVIGSRYVAGAQMDTWSKYRGLLSKLATKLVRITLRTKLKDPLSGFFMIRRRLFERSIPRLSGKGQKTLLDIIMSSPDEVHFKEIPITFRARVHGKSKLNLKVAWNNFLLLLAKSRIK